MSVMTTNAAYWKGYWNDDSFALMVAEIVLKTTYGDGKGYRNSLY